MNKHDILQRYFGYDTFRPGQEYLIDALLEGKDVLGIMPTGAGKSVCYQIPALLLPGVTLVISPLISLMKDQVQALNQAGIHAAYINSSLTEGQIRKALQLASKGQYKIIYVAPERLETYGFEQFALSSEISMVAVDEAHCISQWGQDFRPSYLKITEFLRKLPRRPVLGAFTATATEVVKNDIVSALELRHPRQLVTGFDRKNLYFAVESPKNKERFLLEYVKEHRQESGIIYCATRKNVEKVCELLTLEGISATRYHAGLSDQERIENQEDFIYDRKPVMVATNAFGMGIDKSNVRYVVHFNMPQSMENYYQEAGRAGRDGEGAECVLLYSPQDVVIGRFLMEQKQNSSGESENVLENVWRTQAQDEERLKKMAAYCNTTGCLRRFILNYFGEERTEDCGQCGNCQKEYQKRDVSEEARAVISCIQEQGQRYGISVVIGTLRGAATARMWKIGAEQYACYGALKAWKETDLRSLVDQMIGQEILEQTEGKYALLRLLPAAEEVMRGERAVTFLYEEEPVDEKAREIPGKTAGRTSAGRKGRAGRSGERSPGSAPGNAQGRRSAGRANPKYDVLTARGLELFDRLREARMEIAKEEKIPPYIVFSDKTLVDMCVKLPMNKDQMLAVTGVGQQKLEKYGPRFLQEILSFTDGQREKLFYG